MLSFLQDQIYAYETLGLVPNHEFIRIKTNSLKFLNAYTKCGVGLLKNGFLAWLQEWVGQISLA